MAILGLGFLLVVVFSLLTALSRAHELYCVSLRRGRLLVVRGALPVSVERDLQALFVGSSSTSVLIRSFEREGVVHLEAIGATPNEERQLQTLLGGLDAESLPPLLPRDRAWWRLAGFVWLAWWMEGRNRDEPPEDPPEDGPSSPSNITPFRR